MAYFCMKTGVRIAGPGIVDSYELTDQDKLDSGMAAVERQPAVVEIDGVEQPLNAEKKKPAKYADK
jgi:hypothetical protein